MLRILLVAPALGLHTTPEVRDLSSVHRVTVLSDAVTSRDVYQAARGGYDVIHYSTHSNETHVELSGETLLDTDLLQIARISGAKLVYFSSCFAGRLAHYLVGHGVPVVIHTNTALPDADAWKFPLGFYAAVDRLGNGKPATYVKAFAEAGDGEGLYGLAIAPLLAGAWADSTTVPLMIAPARQPWNRQQTVWYVLMTVFVVWLLVLSIWAMMGG